MRRFDELEAGQVIDLGEVSVTTEEIVAYAQRYDPQPFHVDADAAAASPFGGIIASGWQTCALWMRPFAERFLNQMVSFASPGIEEIRWIRPVRGGDRLTARYEVLEARPSASKPDRGIVRGRGTLVDAEGREVMALTATNLLGRDTAPTIGGGVT